MRIIITSWLFFQVFQSVLGEEAPCYASRWVNGGHRRLPLHVPISKEGGCKTEEAVVGSDSLSQAASSEEVSVRLASAAEKEAERRASFGGKARVEEGVARAVYIAQEWRRDAERDDEHWASLEGKASAEERAALAISIAEEWRRKADSEAGHWASLKGKASAEERAAVAISIAEGWRRKAEREAEHRASLSQKPTAEEKDLLAPPPQKPTAEKKGLLAPPPQKPTAEEKGLLAPPLLEKPLRNIGRESVRLTSAAEREAERRVSFGGIASAEEGAARAISIAEEWRRKAEREAERRASSGGKARFEEGVARAVYIAQEWRRDAEREAERWASFGGKASAEERAALAISIAEEWRRKADREAGHWASLEGKASAEERAAVAISIAEEWRRKAEREAGRRASLSQKATAEEKDLLAPPPQKPTAEKKGLLAPPPQKPTAEEKGLLAPPLLEKPLRNIGRKTERLASAVKETSGGGQAARLGPLAQEASAEQFPYHASIWIDGVYVCGGCLITELNVLTAAHCFYDFYWPLSQPIDPNATAVLGSANLNQGDKYPAKWVAIPKEYNKTSSEYIVPYDIAVLRLKQSVRTSAKIQPAKLPWFSWELPEGTELVVSGFGSEYRDGLTSQVLKQSVVKIVSREACTEEYMKKRGRKISPGQICAGLAINVGTCPGDSGGPLVYRGKEGNIVFGIVSAGAPDCGDGTPDIYTKVSSFTPIIEEGINIESINERYHEHPLPRADEVSNLTTTSSPHITNSPSHGVPKEIAYEEKFEIGGWINFSLDFH